MLFVVCLLFVCAVLFEYCSWCVAGCVMFVVWCIIGMWRVLLVVCVVVCGSLCVGCRVLSGVC